MRFNLSIKKEFQDVYNYLKIHDNASLLICRLVREHMYDAKQGLDKNAEMVQKLERLQKTLEELKATGVAVVKEEAQVLQFQSDNSIQVHDASLLGLMSDMDDFE